MYEIQDTNGVIYSGNFDEIQTLYNDIINNNLIITWNGDLKLVKVINCYK